MTQHGGGWLCGECGQVNPSAQLCRTQAQALSARCTRRVRASARLLRRSAARAPHRRAVAAAAQRAAPPRPPCSGHVDSCTPRPRLPGRPARPAAAPPRAVSPPGASPGSSAQRAARGARLRAVKRPAACDDVDPLTRAPKIGGLADWPGGSRPPDSPLVAGLTCT